jgi:curved DNA-binding protein CbpA
VLTPAAPVAPVAAAVPPAASGGSFAQTRQNPIAEAGPVEQVLPAQAAALERIAESMSEQDYFQILQLTQTATPGEIKKAFYRESRVYHPDRFFHLPEGEVKTHINTISKRITEAYYVLRDEVKRRKYLTDLAGPQRAEKLRYTEASESELRAEVKKAAEDEFGTNPKSRPFFKSALADIEKQNWSSAERNLKMGLTYEPGNARFKEKMAEVQVKLEASRKNLGDSFKIK